MRPNLGETREARDWMFAQERGIRYSLFGLKMLEEDKKRLESCYPTQSVLQPSYSFSSFR